MGTAVAVVLTGPVAWALWGVALVLLCSLGVLAWAVRDAGHYPDEYHDACAAMDAALDAGVVTPAGSGAGRRAVPRGEAGAGPARPALG
jgi:hypothetical protein